MDAVNAFNQELFSLLDMKPPISRAKMISITKSAIKAIKLYKHVVQIVEKFIKKCKPEYKVPGLYVVDSIVRQSRHQFGPDKDVFGPRFTKNITGTFQNLYLCPTEDKSKIVRVLNLWQKNGVFKIEIIQPLLDMAAGASSSTTAPDTENDTADAVGSPSSPGKTSAEPPVPAAVTANSIVAAVPQLQNSDAFAAVAQLFQSTQGQQLQQILQTFQQPAKPQSPAPENNLLAQIQPAAVQRSLPAAQPAEQKATFDKTLLDRFDYDDESEGGEDAKKEETTSASQPFVFPENIQQPVYPQLPTQIPNMEHFQQRLLGMAQEQQHQVTLPPNGQLQGYGLMPTQPFPAMVQQMAQPVLPQQTPAVPSVFPSGYPPQNEAYSQQMAQQQQEVSMEIDPPVMKEGKHRSEGRKSRSKSASRSPKRRRSRSNSRSRRSRHRRSRSRSRDRRRHSPRSRSQERREREKERERRQKGLPHIKSETLSVCSTTLWVGQLDKRTQQQDVASLLEEFGQIESINMIPPRGCAYIVMVHRQDAFRALHKLSRGSYKVNQKAIKIAWALNKGIKPEYKQYWDVDLGVTYIPWNKVKLEDLDSFREGGILDTETLCPEWKNLSNDTEKSDEVAQNGGSEAVQAEETTVVAPVQVKPVGFQVPSVQPMGAVGALQPPGFPAHMGLPPPAFPPGVPPPPPPPFMRPGFNPLQMPPGFLPPGTVPPMATGGPLPPNVAVSVPTSGSSGEDTTKDTSSGNQVSSAVGVRTNSEPTDNSKLYGSVPALNQGIGTNLPVSMPQPMAGLTGSQVGAPGGPVMNLQPPSGGLLGARPGMIPLQRPPGVPPPHMQRFPLLPPRPNMPMPPQMMHRGPPQLLHREPPPGGYGIPPPHSLRGPFSPHGPFIRPGGPRGPPEGPDERDGRQFRSERPGFGPGREREQDRFGRRPFGGGAGGGAGGRGEPEGRDRYIGRHDEYGRDRRDWGRSPEHERPRDGEERSRRASGHRDRDSTRERESRRDREDNRGREKADEAESTDRYRDSDTAEQAASSEKELPTPDPEPTASSDVTMEPKAVESSGSTEPVETPQEARS
nr:PREDICTED: splicing factor, arginine/serine-rich 15 isoform X1 [Lepisosteus oculatus]